MRSDSISHSEDEDLLSPALQAAKYRPQDGMCPVCGTPLEKSPEGFRYCSDSACLSYIEGVDTGEEQPQEAPMKALEASSH
jgi:DNA repair exonuclease SbcCD ATPase subunit